MTATINNETFQTFEEVSYPALRAYNRAVMLYNINEDFGEVGATKYLEQFDNTSRMEIMTILFGVKRDGAEAVKKEIMSRMEVNYVE